MITGKVLAGGEAVVAFTMRGPTGTTANVQAMVDTGFNDDLTLPKWAIDRLGLQFESTALFTIAGGQESQARLFKAQLQRGGTWHDVVVLEVEGDALIGMGAMRHCTLTIDIVEDGRVEIRPLAGDSTN